MTWLIVFEDVINFIRRFFKLLNRILKSSPHVWGLRISVPDYTAIEGRNLKFTAVTIPDFIHENKVQRIFGHKRQIATLTTLSGTATMQRRKRAPVNSALEITRNQAAVPSLYYTDRLACQRKSTGNLPRIVRVPAETRRGHRRNASRKSYPFKLTFLLLFFFLIGCTGLLYQPQMIDDECGTVGGMRIGRGNRSIRKKPAPVPLCPP
jgi:hypothetical protein